MQHDFLKNYKQKTKESSRLYSHAVKVFPGGVNHNIRYFEPYPFFVTGAKGEQLSDVDGNKYTDYWMGHWALILACGVTAGFAQRVVASRGISKFSSYSNKASGMALVGGGAYLVAILF